MSGVSTTHNSYDAMVDVWKQCRDNSKGQRAVHAAGVTYLPKLIDQTDSAYNGYKQRATFYNAYYRTITGLKGMLFKEDPQPTIPGMLDPMVEDITLTGVPLKSFSQSVAVEILTVGRVGVFVDHPVVKAGTTLADYNVLNLRPSMSLYRAESIINWRTGNVNNQNILTMVVLREEKKSVDASDRFTTNNNVQYRVLELVDSRYTVSVYIVNDKGEDVLLSESVPTINSTPLNYIPFSFISTDDLTSEINEPPLVDLSNVNMSHYRTTADLEHGAHFTGLPTPVVSGYTPAEEGEKLYIGSQSAWVFPDPDAKATYLEFSGQGLASLENLLNRKESQMAILGARMLEVQSKGIEAAETAQIHRKGEESVLAGVAATLSMGITKALTWFAAMAGDSTSVIEYEINTDFLPTGMTPQMLTALVGSWQSGAMSGDALFNNLKDGLLYNPDDTYSDEETKISNSKLPTPEF